MRIAWMIEENLTDGVGISADLKSGALALAKHSSHSPVKIR